MPACVGRNDSRHPSATDACVRVVADAQEWPGRLWFSCGLENRADVYACASMAGTCVSFWPCKVDGQGRNQDSVVNDGCRDARRGERLFSNRRLTQIPLYPNRELPQHRLSMINPRSVMS